jgi:hypothetical protein
MNLKQTIDELERQARQYQQAEDALRAIGQNGPAPASQKVAKPVARTGNKANKPKKPRFSDETRAKLSQAMKARHAAKKTAAK